MEEIRQVIRDGLPGGLNLAEEGRLLEKITDLKGINPLKKQ
jgi:hypothetical protein